jgi:hypothetical protein
MFFFRDHDVDEAAIPAAPSGHAENSAEPKPPAGKTSVRLLADGGFLSPAGLKPRSNAKDASVNPDSRLSRVPPTKDVQALANLLDRRGFSDRFRKNLVDAVKIFQLASQGDERFSAESRTAYHQAVVDEIAENPDAVSALLTDLKKEEGVSGSFAEAMLLNMSSDALRGDPKLIELIQKEMIPDQSSRGKPFSQQETNRQSLLFSAALKHFTEEKPAELVQFRDQMLRYHPSMTMTYLEIFNTYYPDVGKAEAP